MTIALRKPAMTRDEFFVWAEGQEGRYEFDGFQPVAMTGGTLNHSQIAQNIFFALRSRLNRNGCRPLGPDAGVATTGDQVRYPDALITCTPGPGNAHLVPGVLVVFEILSPSSGRTDRIDKLREYAAVPSILRYILVEYATMAITVFSRLDGAANWTAVPLTTGNMIAIPEVGIEVPVDDIYQDVDIADD